MGQSPSVTSDSVALVKERELGRGSWGVVYAGKLGSRPVAIKQINQLLTDEDQQRDRVIAQFQREYKILKAAKHQHVVECIDLFREGNGVEIVMELMDQTLGTFLAANEGLLPVTKQVEICLKLANGLQFLHQHNPQILHRDLNANNVLMNKAGDIVKISDFGQSKFRPTSKEFLTTQQPGCVPYMPPEALVLEARFNSKGDVFSLSVLMLQIATQVAPTCGILHIGTPEIKRREFELELLSEDHVLKPLILQCLEDDLQARPDAFSIYFRLTLMLPEASDMHRQYRPLEECCRNGNAEQLQLALELPEGLHRPYDVNQQNGNTGDTCLHIAAASGHGDCVQMLLNKGANCFVKNVNDATALHVANEDHVLSCLLSAASCKALQNDSMEMLNVVCEFPSQLCKTEMLLKTERFQQVLAMAVEKDSALNVAKLAKGTHKLPDIDKTLSRAKTIRAFRAYTVLLMLQAAYADDSQLVRALFGEETAAAPITSDPDFPVIQAVVHDKEFPISVISEVAQQVESMAFCTAVEPLLERSHSHGCCDDGASTEVHPSTSGSHDVPKRSRGAVAERQLHRYCREGSIQNVKELLSTMKANKAHIKAKLGETSGLYRYTPLHEAASTGQAEVLELLLQEDGPVNAKAASGYTPLHLAASGGHSECARLLLQNGADLSAKDDNNKRPLHTAELCARVGVVKVLKSYAIIRAVETNSAQLNELLAVPKESLERECLQTALMVAVEKNSAVNAGQIIIKGRETLDINAALACAKEVHSYAVGALLLLVRAAYNDDVDLVSTLYETSIPHCNHPLISEQDLHLVQSAIQKKQVSTAVPIEIARREKRGAVREELLLRTDTNVAESTVVWSRLCLAELEISWLKRIHWVKKLELAKANVRTLPPQMGNYLVHVTSINLQFNHLREIPRCLLELPCIEDLNLSYNVLQEIPEVHEWATTLAVLDLSHNELQSLPQYCEAPNLKRLSISHNKFRQVPKCICSFTNLITLELGHNPGIVKLPVAMGRLQNLRTLDLEGLDDINDPPKNIRNDAKRCIAYLNQKLRSTRGYYRMKLMVLGECETGKTTLVAQLHGKDVKKGYRQSTVVDVREWRFSSQVGKKTFAFNIWDFGCRKVYYATHQCFLTERSLYLLLWNITHGQKGIRELKPWLDNIALRAPNSKVIIVATFYDRVPEEDRQDGGKVDQLLQQVIQLAQSYLGKLQVKRVTCVGLHGKLQNLDNLKRIIYEEAESYTIKDEKVMGRQIPASYHALDSHLVQIRKDVVQNKHSPIMHAPEFKEMISNLNLSDISSNEEVKTATLFLHEVGSLLHYDDRRNNLDDLYFVDPRWLCDMMSTVVTIEGRNGILTQAELSLLYRSKQFPSKFLEQCLVLLDRFEIALSLDQVKHRILIPSMLPDVRPLGTDRPSDQVCYERQIIFPISTPPGFWSRLLARVMHALQCLRDLIEAFHRKVVNEVVASQSGALLPQRHTWAGSGAKTQAKNKVVSNLCGKLVHVDSLPEDAVQSLKQTEPRDDRPTAEHAKQQWEEEAAQLSMSLPTGSASASLPVMKAGDAVFKYWRSGFNYRDLCLQFLVEDLEEAGVAEVHGVHIVVTPGCEGCKVYGQLIGLVSNLVEEWYPGLLCQQTAEQGLEQRIMCYQCRTEGISVPHVFSKESLVQYIKASSAHVPCPKGHEVALVDLVPDLVLADINKCFHLGKGEVVFKEDSSSLISHGTFASVYRGQCKKQSVAVKMFHAQIKNDPLYALSQLRTEVQVLQKGLHPSLVCMVGVLIFPQPCLVVEEAPLGSLDGLLMKHNANSISRVVLFKLASQIASALKFLHGLSFIYRDLKAANVLLWSLDMDRIVNCKLSGFGISTQAAPIGVKGTRGTPGFTAPEVVCMEANHSHATYDFKADIFSYAMVLFQMITHCKAITITSSIEHARRPCIVGFPVARSGFYFLTGLMKRCWKHSPTHRPTTEEILEQLAKPSVKLTMGVHPIASDYSLQTACCYVSTPSLQHGAAPVPAVTDIPDPPNVELWLCCDSDKGAEITVYHPESMTILKQKVMKDNQVQCMAVCGDNVWVASTAGSKCSQLDIFNASTRQAVHHIHMKDNVVSCITCSDTHIYIGTMEGYVFMYELTLTAIRSTDRPTWCYVVDDCIDSLIISPTSLWVSHTRQVLFCNPKNLETTSSKALPDDIPGYVGHLTLSNSKSLVWSAHWLSGHILCAWETLQQTIKFTIDVGPALLKVEPDTQPNDCIITAVCSALDTVWCGMITGHILVFSEEQDFLLHFRPYQEYVRFLLPIASIGPCLSEECMVVSGGKKYIKNEYLEEVSDDPREPDAVKRHKEDSTLESGTVIVLEALRACHMHQVRILGRGDTWASHDNVRRCEQEWEESKSSWGQVVMQLLSEVSCSSKGAEAADSSCNITSGGTEAVVQADQGNDFVSAIDNGIFSKDSCSSKDEEAAHSLHNITSSSISEGVPANLPSTWH